MNRRRLFYHRSWYLAFALLACMCLRAGLAFADGKVIQLTRSTPPPEWALLERELLDANAAACREFFGQYFDERGFLMCVERWGGDDGPDDAIENCNDWPLLHALGGHDDVLRMYKKAWEGHLRQYTLAKTTEVPFARDGMYYKEFPVTFDWLHNGEGLTVFNLQGLSDPNDREFRRRVRRFAGFYMNEDPQAKNYDAEHKIIRSMFNGSRGPLLRRATGLDWAGDPIEVEGRFSLGHGERSYAEMVAHFKDYNDIVGDHPLNLLATSLALNAYMLTREEKYRRWLLEYVDAWRERMIENGHLIPTKIGLDGNIGGPDGKWYGGVYGWAFSVVVPQDGSLAHRNVHHKGFTGFANAFLLTGDDKYLDPWRKQIEKVNAAAKAIDGKKMYPRMYGDKGWYRFAPTPYDYNAEAICYLSMKEKDRRLLGPLYVGEESHDPSSPYRDAGQHTRHLRWMAFLNGRRPAFPAEEMRRDFSNIRRRIAAMRKDSTTPDTRLADDPMKFNPCSVGSLVHLMCGGLHPGRQAAPFHCRLRYFDPIGRRAGLPDGVAALVEKLSDDSVTVQLVNVNQLEERVVIVQAGGYGEHQFVSVATDGERKSTSIDGRLFNVRLAPGGGGRLMIKMKRYVNRPTLLHPWDLQRDEGK